MQYLFPLLLLLLFGLSATGSSVVTDWKWESIPSTLWSPCDSFPAVKLLDSTVLIVGGSGAASSEVWSTGDSGLTWTRIPSNPPWTPRWGHAAVLLPNGEILLLAGWSNQGALCDVWNSADGGATWTLTNSCAAFGGLNRFVAVVDGDGSVAVMGGFGTDGLSNEIWVSHDAGVTWNLVGRAPWQPRQSLVGAIGADNGILIGGRNSGEGPAFSDMWLTNDLGVSWVEVTSLPEPFDSAGMVFIDWYGTPLYAVIGGRWGLETSSFIWTSADFGRSWERSASIGAVWEGASGFGIALIDSSVLVCGGTTSSGQDSDYCFLASILNCPPGFGIVPEGGCQLCFPGTFSNMSSICQLCPGGTYNPLPGSNSSSACMACLAPSFSYPGATACSNCVPEKTGPSQTSGVAIEIVGITLAVSFLVGVVMGSVASWIVFRKRKVAVREERRRLINQ